MMVRVCGAIHDVNAYMLQNEWGNWVVSFKLDDHRTELPEDQVKAAQIAKARMDLEANIQANLTENQMSKILANGVAAHIRYPKETL